MYICLNNSPSDCVSFQNLQALTPQPVITRPTTGTTGLWFRSYDSGPLQSPASRHLLCGLLDLRGTFGAFITRSANGSWSKGG